MTDATGQADGIAAYAGSGGTGSSRAGRPRGRLPASRIAAISAVLTVMAFAVVACSSSSPGSTPDAGSSPVTTAQLVEFAHCMRSHDVKNFPDPVNGGFSFSGVGPDRVDPSSPAFQAAKTACISQSFPKPNKSSEAQEFQKKRRSRRPTGPRCSPFASK